MTTWLTVTPAYGRDYKSLKAAKEDWLADKDFIETTTGRYVNRNYLVTDANHGTQLGFGQPLVKPIEVMVRFKKLTAINKLETFK